MPACRDVSYWACHIGHGSQRIWSIRNLRFLTNWELSLWIMYFCSRISVPCFLNDAFFSLPLFKYFGLMKEERCGRSAGELCTFPCSCGDREGGHPDFWNPLFQSSALSFLARYHLCTFPLSGALKKNVPVYRVCPLGRNAATRQWAGIFPLAVVGLLFWGQWFGFEQMFSNARC